MPHKRIIALPWYGGKFSQLDFILSYIPRNAKHFLDVYGGSGAVLLNLPRFQKETYNDLNPYLANFFCVLRDNGAELQRRLFLTPYARSEYEEACEKRNKPITDKIEAARYLFIRTKQAFMSLESNNGWCLTKTANKQKMAKNVLSFNNHIIKLQKAIYRMKGVGVENLPAVELIEKYDSPNTLFYLDPPYVHSSRKDTKSYTYEMTDGDHRELAAALSNIKGRAVLSGYKCDLYDKELFKNWRRIDDRAKFSPSAKTNYSYNNVTHSKKYRQESVWINF